MYNTVKELHIALDLALQQINSNRQMSIEPEYKDMSLNYAVLQFIETRTNPKTNIKKEGLEATTKRYDDLRELKKSYNITTRLKDSNTVVAKLPVDYYKYIEFGAATIYSKFKTFKTLHNTEHIYILPFENSISDNQYYKDFIIKTNKDLIFDINDFGDNFNLYVEDAKFMIINLVLEHINRIKDVDVYWEYYGEYYQNSFVIIDNRKGVNNYNIRYDDINVDAKKITDNYTTYDPNEYKSTIRPLDIYSSEFMFSINSNHYQLSNRHINPVGSIINNEVLINLSDNFVVNKMYLVYYKKPRLIDYRTNQMCELSINREIIDLAVQKLQVYLKDEGYQYTASANQIME